jgi:hypothetical protein
MRNLLTLSNFVSIALLREIQPPDCWQQQHLFFRHILLLQVWDLTPKTCQVSLSMPGLNKTRPNMSADPPDPSASKMLGGQKHARFKTRVGNNKTWRVLFFQVPQAVFVFFVDPLKVPRFTVTSGGQTMKSARNIARPSIGNRHRIGKRRRRRAR